MAAVSVAYCASCSKNDGRVPVYPVRGQIFVGEKPATKALVVFHPAGSQDPAALRPYGHVAEDGSFQLTTYDTGDGAPTGDYLVTVVWFRPGGGEDPPDLLKGRYRNSESSQLKAKIQEGSNELAPFKLTP